jgi:hypothetical protein
MSDVVTTRVYRGGDRWHFTRPESVRHGSTHVYACASLPFPRRPAELSPNEVAPDERCQRPGCVEHWPADHGPIDDSPKSSIEETPDLEHDALLKVIAGLTPATAQQVGRSLGKLSMRLQQLTDQLAAADEEATRLTEDYQLAYDQAFLKAGGKGTEKVSAAVREATARVQTHELRLAMEVAKLNVRNLRNAHRTLDRRIDVGRTQAATVRSEHRNIGYGGAA